MPLIIVGRDETKLGIILPGDAKGWLRYVILAMVGWFIIFISQTLLPHVPGLLTPVSVGPIFGYILSTVVIPLFLHCLYPGVGETILALGFFGVYVATSLTKENRLYDLWKKPVFWITIVVACLIITSWHYLFGGYGRFGIDEFLRMKWILPFAHETHGFVFPSGTFAFIMFFVWSLISFLPYPFGEGSILPAIISHTIWNFYVVSMLLGIGVEWFLIVMALSFFGAVFFRRRL